MRTIDGGCFIGRDPQTGYEHSVEAALAEFDRYGVDRALVGSYRALYQDVRRGNREIAEAAGRHGDRIIPLGIVHPAYYGESPEALLAWLRDELGCPAVSVVASPSYYPVDWSSPAVRAIGEAAARLGMVLQAAIRTEAELAAVAAAWGALDTTVMIRWMAGHRYKTLAAELAVARRCPRFLFDVGNLCSSGGVEHAVAAMGADRLFVASNSPHNIAACAHVSLHSARLAPAARAAVSGGTLATVFGLAGTARPPAALPCYESGAWHAFCARPKVDIHWHPDHWNLGEPHVAEADQRAAFDRFGYERVIVSSILALNYDLEAGNAEAATWCTRDPRIFALVVVNPLDLEASLCAIDRWADHPRFVGIKTIQDLYGLTLDDLRYEPLLEAAAARGLPVMAHLPGVAEAARRHPEVRFVAAHANWARARELVALPNVSFDFATGHALRHETQLAHFVREVGAHRVLFGSDGTLVAPAWSLAKLFDAGLKPEEETLILRSNAYQLFPRLGR